MDAGEYLSQIASFFVKSVANCGNQKWKNADFVVINRANTVSVISLIKASCSEPINVPPLLAGTENHEIRGWSHPGLIS